MTVWPIRVGTAYQRVSAAVNKSCSHVTWIEMSKQRKNLPDPSWLKLALVSSQYDRGVYYGRFIYYKLANLDHLPTRQRGGGV